MQEALPFFALALPFLALWFLFAGMETGVFSLNRWRIRQQSRAGRRRAVLLNKYLDDPEHFFWTILIGNTLAGFACVSLLAGGVYQALGHSPLLFWLTFLLGVFLLYVFGDLLPKMLFRQFPNRLTMLAALPFRSVHLLLSPLVWVIEHFTSYLLRWTGGKMFTGHLFASREELRSVMHESAQALSTEERAMINRVLDLQTQTVRQLTTPLTSFPQVRRNHRVADVIAMYEQSQLGLLPVWDESARRVLGVIDLDDIIFKPAADRADEIREFIKPALYVSQETKIEPALRKMQRTGKRVAIVVGPQSKEWGVVRVDDILRQIFGKVTL